MCDKMDDQTFHHYIKNLAMILVCVGFTHHDGVVGKVVVLAFKNKTNLHKKIDFFNINKVR